MERHSGKLHPAGVEMKTVIRATDIRSSSSTDASGFKGEVCNVFVPLMTPNRIAKISDALKSWQIKIFTVRMRHGPKPKMNFQVRWMILLDV